MAQTALTIGTEYPDRLMTGTGKTSDPWIIGGGDDGRNFQNFLDAVYTYGAHIKLENSIDVAESVTYREGLTHPLVIRANTVSADAPESSEKNAGIHNLRIDLINYGDAAAIQFNTTGLNLHTCKISNIDFYGYFQNKGKPLENAVQNTTYLYNCNFSVLHDCLQGTAGFADSKINVEGCSFYYHASNYSGSDAIIFGFTTIKKGAIDYSGALSNDCCMISNATYVSLVADLDIETTDSNLIAFNNCSWSYLSVRKLTIAEGALPTFQAQGTINHDIICLPDDAPESVSVETSDNFTKETAEHLKDRDYLYSIGFLP